MRRKNKPKNKTQKNKSQYCAQKRKSEKQGRRMGNINSNWLPSKISKNNLDQYFHSVGKQRFQRQRLGSSIYLEYTGANCKSKYNIPYICAQSQRYQDCLAYDFHHLC